MIDAGPSRAYGPELPPNEPARPAHRATHADLLVQDPKNFELFFQILEVPGIDQEYIWELLKALPPSREIQVLLHEGDASPQVWQNLLHRSPLHKRIYVLDLCDKIIADKDLEVRRRRLTLPKVSRKWCKRFFSTGGFHTLFELLLGLEKGLSPATVRERYWKQYFHLLLKIVLAFMTAGGLAEIPLVPEAESGMRYPP